MRLPDQRDENEGAVATAMAALVLISVFVLGILQAVLSLPDMPSDHQREQLAAFMASWCFAFGLMLILIIDAMPE